MSKLPPCNKQTAKTHQTKETAARRRQEDAVVTKSGRGLGHGRGSGRGRGREVVRGAGKCKLAGAGGCTERKLCKMQRVIKEYKPRLGFGKSIMIYGIY